MGCDKARKGKDGRKERERIKRDGWGGRRSLRLGLLSLFWAAAVGFFVDSC